MTSDSDQTTNTGVKSPIILRPWLVLVAALALYGLTLNHWVTINSLPFAAQISGWDWHPGPLSWRPAPQYHPLTLILTFPLRLLPVSWRIPGLNLLTAACAALTLAILARSVRLLPHSRTKDQLAVRARASMSMGEAVSSLHDNSADGRTQDGGEHSLLSIRATFLPAAFAVLLLAAQLTFWQNAISGTGEMIDLLVFAGLILCLLEFRISQKNKWLSLFAFAYGMGTSNNWALIGFFPCFFVALIWLKRLSFFNWRFLARLTGWGVAGLLLYGLVPLLGAISSDGSFWSILRRSLAEQHLLLIRMPRYFLLIAGLPTLLPLLFAAINWPSPEGEFSIAHSVGRLLFQVLHIACLAIAVLMFFDISSSPSPRARFGLGVMGGPAFLSFYYLAALNVGYFSGYVLLVFGRIVTDRWGQATGLIRAFNKTVLALLWAAAIVSPAILLYVNFQHIRDFNSNAVTDFATEMATSLPQKPAIVLADDPTRLYLAMGASQRLGLPNQYIFVDSPSLRYGEYLRYLVKNYPAFRKDLVDPARFPREVTSRQIGLLLAHLAITQPVYYLQPSFGSYFEQACLTPRRLGQDLHPNPNNALSTLMLASAETATNQAYWHKLEDESLASLPELAERSPDARRVANYYSQIVDCWGADLQKAATELKLPVQVKDAMLTDANDQFTEAFRLNTNNIIARANQQFNARLRGVPPVGTAVDLSELAARIYGHWDIALTVFGYADVPELQIEIGRYFAERGVYLQAARSFEHCLDIAPDSMVGALDLAKIYIDLGLVDAALGVINKVHAHPTDNPLELLRVETLAYVTKGDFPQADALLTEARKKNPKDEKLDAITAEFYRLIGYEVLQDGKRDTAQAGVAEKKAALWFQKALTVYDEQLQLLTGHAGNTLEISAANLRKAEVQMAIKDFEAAIVTLNTMVVQEPDKPIPLLNRAVSELQLNRLDAAKNDFLAVEKMESEPWLAVYLGLAQVAHKQDDKSGEIHFDKLYLKYASHAAPDFTNVTQQLHALEGN
jgi:tetratricopeptide (TPR) repeat protein